MNTFQKTAEGRKRKKGGMAAPYAGKRMKGGRRRKGGFIGMSLISKGIGALTKLFSKKKKPEEAAAAPVAQSDQTGSGRRRRGGMAAPYAGRRRR